MVLGLLYAWQFYSYWARNGDHGKSFLVILEKITNTKRSGNKMYWIIFMGVIASIILVVMHVYENQVFNRDMKKHMEDSNKRWDEK